MRGPLQDSNGRVEAALRLLRGGVVGGYVVAVLLGIFLPIYTDEIGWRFQERAGLDGVDKMFSDSCGANSIAAPPWFMWPVRLFSAALNLLFDAPLYVRLSGILYALLWGGLLLALIRRIAADREERLALGAIGFGLLCLANTPLLMVMSRPEQPMILTAAGALLLSLPRPGRPSDTSPAAAWWRSFAVLALATIALSYHLKGLFLAPLFLAALVLASRGAGTLLPRAAAGVLLIAFTLVATQYWSARLACPDDPVLRAEYARNSAGAVLAELRSFADLPPILATLWRNMNPFDYILLARPERFPLSEWLPPYQVSRAAMAQWGIALTLLWGLVLATAGAGLIAALRDAWRARRLSPRLVLTAMLLAAVLGWGATRLVRNFYEASFMLPLLATAALLALSSDRTGAAWRRARVLVASVIGSAGLVSLVLTIGIWAPSLHRTLAQDGYVEGQGHSVAIRGFDRVAREIRETAALCDIPEPRRAKGLMLDELSYFPYMRSRLPQHHLGVIGIWKGSIDDPIAYLESRNSDGILVACEVLTPELRARARRNGEFCCLAPPGW